MRILWFYDVAPISMRKKYNMAVAHGTGSWLEELQSALVRQGTITLGIAATSDRQCDPWVDDGVTYYTLPGRTIPNKFLRAIQRWTKYHDDASQLMAAQKVIEEFKPDVIHVQGTENPYGALKNSTNIPLVISLQGILTQCRQAYFRGLAPRDILRLFFSKRFLKGSGEIHGYLRMAKMARREMRIMRINRAFIGRTEWDHAFQQIYSPNAQYFHCDEVMRPVFFETPWSVAQSSPNTIFCTSSSMFFKGTEVLLEAAGLLLKIGIKNLHIRIAGVPDHGEVADFYKRKSKNCGADGNVTFLGRVSSAELKEELLRASLFVYPSHMDNSPNSLVEAMLVGVPCIASYVGGIPSLIKDDVDGWLVPDNDACALAAKILFALNDPEARVRVGENARARSLLRNDPKQIAEKTIAIYKNLKNGAAGC